MNRYIKLVLMEVHRFRWALAVMLGVTILWQMAGLLWEINQELRYRENVRLEQPTTLFSSLSLEWAVQANMNSIMLSLMLCAFVLLSYVFVIWYRDWIGRSAFIYRLLMLPTARRNLYLAKATTILLLMLSFASFQFLLIGMHHLIAKLLIPEGMWEPSLLMNVFRYAAPYSTIIPENGLQWLYNYGLGVIAIFVIFTAILIERSYGRLGILYSLIYLGGCAALIGFPMAFGNELTYLYPAEIVTLYVTICVLVLAVTIWLGLRLIAKKITV